MAEGVAAIVKSTNESWSSVSDRRLESFGWCLRHIRQKKGMTVEALAKAAGLDKGFLSRLERGAKQPSVETVLRLSTALEVPVGQLFGDETTEDTVRISRVSGRNRFEQSGGYGFELLTPKGGLIEGFLFEAGPEFVGSGQQHDGEEIFFVLAGTVEMRTPDRSYVLETGDCAYFPGHLAHSMRRIGPTPAIAIIAVTRPERSRMRGRSIRRQTNKPAEKQ
jgi:transcriptional regulator with XRE-family HTH domain